MGGENGSNNNSNKTNGLNSIFGYFTGGGSNKRASAHIEQQTSVSSSNNINANNSSDYNFTEDLMQLFSVVNIRIQKVTKRERNIGFLAELIKYIF